MATEITGMRSHERGRFVPWGPMRDGHASHLVLGGNTTVASVRHDSYMEDREHDLNTRVMDLAVVASRVAGTVMEVDVRVESQLVGHYLPSVATQNRYFWIEVRVLDPAGATLSSTPEPQKGDDVGRDTPVIYRCMPARRPDCDTVLSPHVPRVFTARLNLQPGAQPARIEATLHLSLDHRPLRTATAAFPLPG
jgi:hypothetical protein